jgi:hypothetical protein
LGDVGDKQLDAALRELAMDGGEFTRCFLGFHPA